MTGAPRGSAILLGLVGVTMFAGTLPATRIALEGFDPAFITFARALLAALLSLVALAITRQPLPARHELPAFGAIALCLVCGFPLFSGLAMERVPASHGGVVLAVLPLGTAVAAALVGGERPGRRFWLLGCAGALLVLTFVLAEAGWHLRSGDAYLLAAAASAALGYALSGRLSRTRPGWSVMGWTLVMAMPVTAVLTGLTSPQAWPRSPAVWSAFFYLGAISMILGFLFWNAAMARGGIAKIAQIQLLQPFLTMLIAAVVAGEPLEPRMFVVAAAVVGLVAAAQRVRVNRATLGGPGLEGRRETRAEAAHAAQGER